MTNLRRKRHVLVIALAVGIPAACNSSEQPTANESAPAVSQPKPTTAQTIPVQAHMKEHFARAIAIRDAVVRGDYEATREPAKWLAEHGAPANIPDPWIEHVTELRVLAGGLEDAKSIEEVGQALGPVANSCGNCHEDLGAKIPYVVGSVPRGESYQDAMQRHKWAADRLWKGLVIPRELVWQRGAEHIASVPLRPKRMSGDASVDARMMELTAQLRDLGKQAVEAKDGPQRASIYGDLLTTCTKCHEIAKPK